MRMVEESKRMREKWHPIMYDRKENDERHVPMFDLNDEHQKEEEEEDDDDDIVGENYNKGDQKETVEKFLAEAYQNLINPPNNDTQKSKSFSFDINEEICEEEEEEKDINFFSPSDQTVDELLAEAYDNLINNPKTQPDLQKEKEKRRRKKLKTSTPTPLPPPPNTTININEKITEKIREEESMEVQKAGSIANVEPKLFNIKEESTEDFMMDAKPITAVGTGKTVEGGGGGSSSCVGYLNMDECDLINHIPESSDMFDLAMFLATNRGSGGF